MIIAGVVASVVVGVLIASQQEGAAGALLPITIALVFCSSIACLALIGPPLVTPERFGLVVLGSTAARTMICVLLILILTQAQGLAKRPVAYGMLSGTLMLLVIEAAAAVWMLARIDLGRARAVLPVHSNEISDRAAADVAGVSDRSRA